MPVPLFSSKYHIQRPFFRLKIARFFSRWHGWDREEWCGYLYFWHVVLIIVVWYEMRQSRLIVKLRLFKTCFIVTFWGVLLQVFTGPQCVFNFFFPHFLSSMMTSASCTSTQLTMGWTIFCCNILFFHTNAFSRDLFELFILSKGQIISEWLLDVLI